MQWEKAGVKTPGFDVKATAERTKKSPLWLHFGAGNIFRGFVAVLQQRLLESGDTDRGIIAAETFDPEIIDKIFHPRDNMTLNVILDNNGTLDCEVISSVTEAISLNADWQRAKEIFDNPSLQLVSFTITEKGYQLRGGGGDFLPVVLRDMENGPERPQHIMSVMAGMLYFRYIAGAFPLAMVSMDNCSRNGDVLRKSILEVAESWQKAGFVDAGFIEYLKNKISYPLTMIDKITPGPSEQVAEQLKRRGIKGITPFFTERGAHVAPFVNAERPQYLVLEDKFPAGRPPFEKLEKFGVFLTDAETVNKAERMKVTTCLNPLHTAMAIYACLLGYTSISDAMKDEDIVKLIRRLGYTEGLPVVTDPEILSPRAFLNEVINERFPNPFIPDTPLRITTDTSQKVGIRFGETIKSYFSGGHDIASLVAIPLSIAGWFRYLLAKDDAGGDMEVSPDPMLEELRAKLKGIVWDDQSSYKGQIRDILKNEIIFGIDLTPLAHKIEKMFAELLGGPGAVRKTLKGFL